MEIKYASNALDDILTKTEKPHIAVIGPGLNEDLQIIDASLFYYLNRLFYVGGTLTVIDKNEFILNIYKKEIGNDLCIHEDIHNKSIPLLKNINYIRADAANLNDYTEEKFDIVSYHCTLPWISKTEEGIKKTIDSALHTLKKKGKLIFMSYEKNGLNYNSKYHERISGTNEILKSLLWADERFKKIFKAEEFDILEDAYILSNKVKKSKIWPFSDCNKMTIATKN